MPEAKHGGERLLFQAVAEVAMRRFLVLLVPVFALALASCGIVTAPPGTVRSASPSHPVTSHPARPEPTSPPEPSPAASPSPPVSQALGPGMSGPDVRELQQRLAALDYYPGPVDGQFGPDTLEAVWAFQEAQGLPAQDEVTSAMQRALEAGVELRLVVRDESVRRVLSLNGVDRMMPVYRDVTTATYQ